MWVRSSCKQCSYFVLCFQGIDCICLTCDFADGKLAKFNRSVLVPNRSNCVICGSPMSTFTWGETTQGFLVSSTRYITADKIIQTFFQPKRLSFITILFLNTYLPIQSNYWGHITETIGQILHQNDKSFTRMQTSWKGWEEWDLSIWSNTLIIYFCASILWESFPALLIAFHCLKDHVCMILIRL